MLSDIEIARKVTPLPLSEVAQKAGIPDHAVLPYGKGKAKIDTTALPNNKTGKLVLVTAVSPTPAGEGKTTTSIGLHDALCAQGIRSLLCLREPSMGPVFGVKGGATGGGYAQIIPMEDINLAFTGDFPAIAAANNLLAAMIDNHIQHGNELRLDLRQIWWKRAIDMNDRTLRQITVGLGGKANGFTREDGFDIVAASEIMAVLCLATDLSDLRTRLGNMVVGLDLDGKMVTAEQLGAVGAMTAILKDAFEPNLVQTLEGNPVLVHGGPFANIAHGCSSLRATKAALQSADVVITEAGFGADLGAEKFYDIKCRLGGFAPQAVVLVATIRSVKYNAGVALKDLNTPDVAALEKGIANILRHIDNLKNVLGARVVVALNRFPSDTDEEVQALQNLLPVPVISATHFSQGGAGATDLATAVLTEIKDTPQLEPQFVYPLDASYPEKVEAIVTKIYRGKAVTWEVSARNKIKLILEAGYTHLPICIAKTQSSFSQDPKALGAPTDHTLHIREVRLSAGAGFIVLVAGAMMTMPGLPAKPAAFNIDVDETGNIQGIS